MQRFIRLGVALATVAALASMPSAVKAQSASITATAVVAGALTVTGVRNLDFGTVIPTFTRTVLPSDPTAGHFRLDGGVNAEVQLGFSSLPGTLNGVTPGNTLTGVTYTGAYNTVDVPGSSTPFTPSAGLTTRLGAALGQLHIYLGGSVSVPAGQATDTYTGTITLDASYTGN